MKALWIAALCAAGAVQAANETCDTDPNAGCPPGEVLTWQKACPMGGPVASCFLISQPPPAEILCASGYGTVNCEAWPQSNGLTYRYYWSVINGVAPGYITQEFDPMLYGNCTPGQPGRVAVTVVAPDGTSSTASVRFLCERP